MTFWEFILKLLGICSHDYEFVEDRTEERLDWDGFDGNDAYFIPLPYTSTCKVFRCRKCLKQMKIADRKYHPLP